MKNMNHTPPNLMVGQQNYTRDRKRIRSRKEALLDFLSDGAWKANYQCAEAGGISYHCALYALRTEGWVIETRRVKGGVYEHCLVGRGARRARTSLSGPQQRVVNDFALAVRKVYGDTGLKEVRKQLSPWLVQATKGDDDTVANAAPKTSNNGTSDSGADDKGGAASA